MPGIETTSEWVRTVYERLGRNVGIIRGRLGRPLTYAEKVFLGHLADPEGAAIAPGESYMDTRPDRVAMQDATAQMALLQFMLAGRKETAVPTTVHCDHLIQAHVGAASDLRIASDANREVYEFLRTASARYGIGFWAPGAGIIHQVVLEKYAFPGGMMIGTDSHTPNAGGLGMFACGVGGADAVDVMAGFPWEVLHPKLVGVHLTGELSGWTAPKDVILKVCELLTVKGGTNRVIEYFGPGTESISCTGKGTITNMGAELGATTSIFPFDARMAAYLEATWREEIAELARQNEELLRADAEVHEDPERFFDEVVEIDLSALEPHIVGPHTPDLARPVSRMAGDVAESGYPEAITAGLIGSCTNSSYEDLERAADVARQARSRGARARAKLWVTPGSEQIHQTILRDGQLEDFEAIGGVVLANACGPCIGQWKRDDVDEGKSNSILTSYNRNFRRRNDGNAATHSFIGSPEIVVAYALAGTLCFDPLRDEIETRDGTRFKLAPPAPAPEVPQRGFVESRQGYRAPPEDRAGVEVAVASGSERLQILEPFPAPREHQRQHVHRCRERLHRRDRQGAGPALGRAGPGLRGDRASLQGRGPALGRGGRRELRRGFQSRARGHVAPTPRLCGGDRAQHCAHPRIEPEEAGGAAAHLRGPGALRQGAGIRPRKRGGSRRAGTGAPAPCDLPPPGRQPARGRGESLAVEGADRVVQGRLGPQPAATARLTPRSNRSFRAGR
jgi:aconitate hydratase